MHFQSKFPLHSSEKQKKKHPKIYIKSQETPESQSDPEQKEKCWRDYTGFQGILQRYSNKKQPGTVTKTDMETSGTKYKSQPSMCIITNT